jgi:hypothetical protein
VKRGAAQPGRWARRPAAVLLACVVGVGVSLFGAVAASDGRVVAPARAAGGSSGELAVAGTGTATFSAVVHPGGRATTAFFEFGLDPRYREPRSSRLVYDDTTPTLHLAAAAHVYSVSGKVSGLVPNALYHLRLVASSSAGTVSSPDATFWTAKDPSPPPPRIGGTVNVTPVSGLVLIRPPRATASRAPRAAGLVEGEGFLPLTEARRLPVNSQIDARPGSMRLVAAGSRRGQTQRATVAGGLFLLSQTRHGPVQGLTTLDLLEGDFRGAPTYSGCDARAAQPSNVVLQTLDASDQAGRFQVRGRYGSATASAAGTAWDTIDRCDGTLIIVHRGSVTVSDFALGNTIAVHAGQRYLASAP